MINSLIQKGKSEDTQLLIQNITIHVQRKSYSNYTIRIRNRVLIAGLVLFIYLLLLAKTLDTSHQKIEEAKKMVEQTQMQIMRLHVLDQQLALQIQKVKSFLNYTA